MAKILKTPGFKCYEGHVHYLREAAVACDLRHWRERAREYGLSSDYVLRRGEPDQHGEQIEAFPDLIREK